MNVLFIHDHDVTEIPDGGAQQTTAELIRRCPYEVELALPGTIDGFDLEAYDVLVVSNCKFFHGPQLERILAHRCFVKHERDYYNLVTAGHEKYRKALFEQSVCNVFLSPGHAQEFVNEHEDIDWTTTHNAILPPPVDPATFKPYGQRRRDVYVYVSALHEHKGPGNVVTWAREHPDAKVEVYGRGPGLPALEAEPNIECRGVIAQENMADLYNSVTGFIHVPNWMEPFGRSVAEARLCGCEMVLNDRVGAATWPWFDDYNQLWVNMTCAASSFWSFIAKVREES